MKQDTFLIIKLLMTVLKELIMGQGSFLAKCTGLCDLLLKLYKALVRPIVDYGNVIYGIHTLKKKKKKSIANIQLRATRMIPEMKELAYTDRLNSI